MRLNITSKSGLASDTVLLVDGRKFNDCHRVELTVDVNEGLPRATLHTLVIESRPSAKQPRADDTFDDVDTDAGALAVDLEARVRHIVRHLRLFDNGTEHQRTFTIEPQADGSWLVSSRPDSDRLTERASLQSDVKAHPAT